MSEKMCGGCEGEVVRVDGKFVHKAASDAARCGSVEVSVLKLSEDGGRPKALGPAFYGQDVEAAREAIAPQPPVTSVGCPRCALAHRYPAERCAACGLKFDAVNMGVVLAEERGVPPGVRPEVMALCEPEMRLLDTAASIQRQGYWRAVRDAAEGAVQAKGAERGQDAILARAKWVGEWWERTPSRGSDDAAPKAGDYLLSSVNILSWTGSSGAYLVQPPSAMFAEARKGSVALLQWIAQLAFAQDVADELADIIVEHELMALQAEPTFREHEA